MHYLKIFLAMESDSLGFDFTILDVDLVAAENNRNILAHAHKILVPRWHVLVCDARCHVEHDDGTLSLYVVSVAEAAELFLASCVPHVECDRTTVRREAERMDLYSECRNVLLLKLASQMSLHECCLANTTVTDEYKLLRNKTKHRINRLHQY